MNGLLDALVGSKSIGAAFGWALHCFNQNARHHKARQILHEVVIDYPEMLDMLDKIYRKGSWSIEASLKETNINEKLFIESNKNEEAVKDEEMEVEADQIDDQPNIEDLKTNKFSWISLGNLICQLYARTDISHTATFTLDDFLQTYFEQSPNAEASNTGSLSIGSPKIGSPKSVEPESEVIAQETPMDVDFETTEPLEKCEELEIDDHKTTTISKNGPTEFENLFGFITPDDSQTNDRPEEPEENKVENGDEPAPSVTVEPVDTADQNTTEPAEATSETNTDNECSRKDIGNPLHPSIADLKDSAKRRRRGSELADLQQWGWHKNRRSKRKRVEAEDEPTDTSINGFIRRILPKYFIENFDGESTLGQQKDSSASCTLPVESTSVETFNNDTVDQFEVLKAQLSNQKFDLILLSFEYLKHLAAMWNRPVPDEIQDLFVKVFEIYSIFMDFDCLNLLVDEQSGTKQLLLDHIKVILFYAELTEDKSLTAGKEEVFQKYCTVLRFYIGWLLQEPEYIELSSRHLWLLATISYNKNHLEETLDYCRGVAYIIQTYNPTLSVTLPNLKKRNHFTADLMERSIGQVKRLINLRQTRVLYAQEKYSDLIEVLEESLLGSEDIESDQHGLNRHGQIQMMLESLWCEERYEDCLKWMEKCLTYTVDSYLATPNHSPTVKRKWAESTNFILTYFEQLLHQEGVGFLLTLKRYFARLIQTLTRLVTIQLDSETNNKSSPVNHHINVRKPWVILYFIVQREDDLNSAAMKDLEHSFKALLMPNAIQLFFTVHEYLGRKSWCSIDDSQFLLMIINTVTPRLRTPELEHVRSNLMEMMEQVTYCLYNYPPKKMRSKHIEEHNAKTVELTWERAVQLFDLYRPDNLPEFDSFKLLSISADMEALLQRILKIMPKCLDISQFISLIEEFIDNKTSKLPNEMNIMPIRIQ